MTDDQPCRNRSQSAGFGGSGQCHPARYHPHPGNLKNTGVNSQQCRMASHLKVITGTQWFTVRLPRQNPGQL